MVSNKSLDPYIQIIAALLRDVQTLHGEVLTARSVNLTIQKIVKRTKREGIGFLTKTLPRLGKALDRALSGGVSIDAASLMFSHQSNSKLPKLFGEFFNRIFALDGTVLPTPCVTSIKSLRQLLFVFYKLELPYDSVQNQKVIDKFIKTDQALSSWNELFCNIADLLDVSIDNIKRVKPNHIANTIRIARRLLSDVLCNFNPLDITPRHGPGAVSTREQLSGKYVWSQISPRITQTYPLDEYFFASLGHVCDDLVRNNTIEMCENSARVILVPKDSRGPRLISCEPVDFQWIQQGLGRALVQHLEKHPLTRYALHFTDQMPNRIGALFGSKYGQYSTLDLNEASDRISIGLVRLLFPKHIFDVLMNCRSQSTVLPGGEVLNLNKFAPMGSALCFPILALSIWAILAAGLPDAGSSRRLGKNNYSPSVRDYLLVYGDDVIVPTAHAANAINLLESFGLLINRDKSCTNGLFRESCGLDAYAGIDVTPVRFRTVWNPHRRPDVYTSYIAYANALYSRGYFQTYNVVVELLHGTYREIPEVSMNLSCPSLVVIPECVRPQRRRVNKSLQKLEWYVYDVESPKCCQVIGGWSMLLRFFVEGSDQTPLVPSLSRQATQADAWNRQVFDDIGCRVPFSVSQYTKRSASYLVKRWR